MLNRLCFKSAFLKFPAGVGSKKEDVIAFVVSFEQGIVYFGLAVVGIHELRADR